MLFGFLGVVYQMTRNKDGVIGKFWSQYSTQDHVTAEITNNNDYPVTISIKFWSECKPDVREIKKKFSIDANDFLTGKISGVLCTQPNGIFSATRRHNIHIIKVKKNK